MRNIGKNLLIIFTILTLFYVVIEQRQLAAAMHPMAETELTTLRCGYITYPPYFERDANSNQPKGLMVDIMNEVAGRSGLKLQWVEETTWATMFEGFKTGRYDAVCSGIWPNAARARQALFSDAAVYVAADVYQRAGAQAHTAIPDLNHADLKTVTIDGELSSTLRAQRLPQTQNLSLPQQTVVADMLMAVTSGKADLAIVERRVAQDYALHNPGLLMHAAAEPAAQFPVVVPVDPKHPQLREIINTTLEELRLSGELSKIVTRYEVLGATEPAFSLSPKN